MRVCVFILFYFFSLFVFFFVAPNSSDPGDSRLGFPLILLIFDRSALPFFFFPFSGVRVVRARARARLCVCVFVGWSHPEFYQIRRGERKKKTTLGERISGRSRSCVADVSGPIVAAVSFARAVLR